mgnify:CR=1 FL=1
MGDFTEDIPQRDVDAGDKVGDGAAAALPRALPGGPFLPFFFLGAGALDFFFFALFSSSARSEAAARAAAADRRAAASAGVGRRRVAEAATG